MALFGLGGSKSTVALDVGSGLIKLVEIDHSKGEPVLSRVAMTPVLADAIVEGEIMDPGVVSDAIRGLFKTAGIKTKKVVVAVTYVTFSIGSPTCAIERALAGGSVAWALQERSWVNLY